MKAIDYVARTDAGNSQRGSVSQGDDVSVIPAGNGQEISLNLRQIDIASYDRDGSNLVVNLADGRVIVLEGYFGEDGTSESRLFISADGYLNEVTLIDGSEGSIYAQYGPTEMWGKWSPSDDLVFLGGSEVVPPAAADEEVSMLGAGLLGGSGLMSALGLGAAGVAATSVLALEDDGGGSPRIEPSVNEDQPIVVGGDDATDEDKSITISGEAEPESEVTVTIGDESQTTIANDDGKWEVTFEGEDFPEDGDYTVEVTVTEPDGTETELEGPSISIDTTAPVSEVSEGTVDTSGIVNADDFEDGIDVSGTGEAGATIEVTIEDHTETTTVQEDGTWGVTFDPSDLPKGDYDTEMTVVSTDQAGNSSTITKTVSIDTVYNELEIETGSSEANSLINTEAVENDGGVVISGTTEPGATVTVAVGEATQDVTADQDGNWQATFDPADLPGDQFTAEITATTTDEAGNTTTKSSSVEIDLAVQDFAYEANIGGDDGVINADESGGGFSLSGTVEPGSTVVLEFQGVTVDAVVNPDGTWTASFDGSQIPAGEYTDDVTITATDPANNQQVLTHSVTVDTDPGSLSLNPVGDDNVVNAQVVQDDNGLVISGASDPGDTVTVKIAGLSQDVTADQDGNWQATFDPADLPSDQFEADVTASIVDAAGNTASTSSTVEIDLAVQDFAYEANIGGGDGVINADESGDGFSLTGTVEPGSTVKLEFEGSTVWADVDPVTGAWTASFSGAQIPSGDYSSDVTITATDAANNVQQLSQTVRVDTDPGSLTMNTIGNNGVVNFDAYDAGIEVTGTGNPNAQVEVEFNGVGHTVTANSNGQWQTTYTMSELPAGDYNAQVTATVGDVYGNSYSVDQMVDMDTVVDDLTMDTPSGMPTTAEGLSVINQDKADGGFEITGTVETGSTVWVGIDGVRRQAEVDEDTGAWVARFEPGAMDGHQGEVDMVVEVQDGVGNIDEIPSRVLIDTVVDDLASLGSPEANENDLVGLKAARDGMTLSGTAEPGSAIEVLLFEETYTATADASGNWSLIVPRGDIPATEDTAQFTVQATDIYGNVDTTKGSVSFDMVAPYSPLISNLTEAASDGYSAVSTATTTDTIEFHQIDESGITSVDVDSTALGSSVFNAFVDVSGNPAPVPDGSQLLVTATDQAGNTSSTYVVPGDNSMASLSDLPSGALGDLHVETVDLRFGEHSELSITEEQLLALSENTDKLVVEGDADNTLVMRGAMSEGAGTNAPAGYDIYSLGDDATIVVDEDIDIVT